MLGAPSIIGVIRLRALSQDGSLWPSADHHTRRSIVNTFSCLIVWTSFTTNQNCSMPKETTIANGAQSPLRLLRYGCK